MEFDTRVLLSPNNAALALDVSRSQVYKLMRAGRMKFALIGADRRIPMSEIDRLAMYGTKQVTKC
jgi:excisionase family DNA binding protein